MRNFLISMIYRIKITKYLLLKKCMEIFHYSYYYNINKYDILRYISINQIYIQYKKINMISRQYISFQKLMQLSNKALQHQVDIRC